MDRPHLLALYDRQLRIEIEYPGVQKETFPHLVRFVRPAPGMNYVLYSHLDGATIDAVIQDQIAFFCQMDQPFSWHVYDHDTPLTLKDRLVTHGFAPDNDPDAIMVLDLEDAPSILLQPAPVDVCCITQMSQLDDLIRVEEQVLGGNFNWLKDRLASHLALPDYVSVYVAYVEDQPACTGWIYFHAHSQFAGLFGGATVSAYRKQGLYSAVLAIRVQEAIRRGYRYVTTGASPMSRPILAKNGFGLLTYAHAYEWKGNCK